MKKIARMNELEYSYSESRELLPRTGPRGYKTFFMLNSAENEICSTYKKLNTNNFNFFPAKQSWAWIFSCQ